MGHGEVEVVCHLHGLVSSVLAYKYYYEAVCFLSLHYLCVYAFV